MTFTIYYINKKAKKSKPLSFLSGRQDSNLRPPVPKTGALPGCATPRSSNFLHCSKLHF